MLCVSRLDLPSSIIHPKFALLTALRHVILLLLKALGWEMCHWHPRKSYKTLPHLGKISPTTKGRPRFRDFTTTLYSCRGPNAPLSLCIRWREDVVISTWFTMYPGKYLHRPFTSDRSRRAGVKQGGLSHLKIAINQRRSGPKSGRDQEIKHKSQTQENRPRTHTHTRTKTHTQAVWPREQCSVRKALCEMQPN